MSQGSIATPAKHYRGPDTFDVIVVGSGLGGLGTAAVLAKQAGRRVLVLERHYTPGGMTHAFRRPGFEWDLGVHYVGDMHPGAASRRLVDYVTEGRLEWTPMPDVYDRGRIRGPAFDYERGRDRLRAALHREFPAEASAIDEYFQLVRTATSRATLYFAEKALPTPFAAALGGLMRRPVRSFAARTTGDVLDRLTSNGALKAVLTAQWGDYGLPPGRSSFLAHAIVTQHYFEGGSYPVGGAGRIAEAIYPAVERAGGVLLVDADVSRIVVRHGRVAGVTLAGGQAFHAPVVVSDAGVVNTVERLVSDEARPLLSRLERDVRGLMPSTGHLCLYVGLDAAPQSPAGNIWIYPGFDHDDNVARSAADPDQPLPMIYISWPSAKDPTFAARHGGRATAEVISVAPFSWFSRWADTRWGRRGDEYDAFKARLTERLLDALYTQAPGVRGHVQHAELSTPVSTRHFANHAHGEMYGLAHTPARFLTRTLRPRTAIGGLFLAGQDVTLCGVMGALSSAFVCTSAVLGRDTFSAVNR